MHIAEVRRQQQDLAISDDCRLPLSQFRQRVAQVVPGFGKRGIDFYTLTVTLHGLFFLAERVQHVGQVEAGPGLRPALQQRLPIGIRSFRPLPISLMFASQRKPLCDGPFGSDLLAYQRFNGLAEVEPPLSRWFSKLAIFQSYQQLPVLGETLTICHGPEGGARPAEFKSTADFILSVYKRVK